METLVFLSLCCGSIAWNAIQLATCSHWNLGHACCNVVQMYLVLLWLQKHPTIIRQLCVIKSPEVFKHQRLSATRCNHSFNKDSMRWAYGGVTKRPTTINFNEINWGTKFHLKTSRKEISHLSFLYSYRTSFLSHQRVLCSNRRNKPTIAKCSSRQETDSINPANLWSQFKSILYMLNI